MTEETKNQFFNKIKSYEGVKLKAYKCPAGIWTIGVGHTTGVKPGMVITESQATEYLKEDFNKVFKQIDGLKLKLQEHERYALASFVFNVGIGTFKKSSVYKYLLTYDYNTKHNLDNIAESLLKYNKYRNASGKLVVSSGLDSRRRFEVTLFKHNKID